MGKQNVPKGTRNKRKPSQSPRKTRSGNFCKKKRSDIFESAQSAESMDAVTQQQTNEQISDRNQSESDNLSENINVNAIIDNEVSFRRSNNRSRPGRNQGVDRDLDLGKG